MRTGRLSMRARPRPPGGEASRRSVLLLGGLGAGAFLAGRWVADPAAATSTAPAGRHEAGLPPTPTPPAAGSPPDEPRSSGAIGHWQASGHEASDAATDLAAATGDGVHLLGDSIGSRLLPALRARVSGRPLSYDVWNGRPTPAALDTLARTSAERGLAPTVLVVCGSNDIFDPWHLEQQVDRAREIVGRRRLLWVTPFVSRPSAPAADMRNSAVLGLALERAAAVGTVELVRWFEYLARLPGNTSDHVEDGVHPTPRGAAALADLVLASLH